MSPHVPAPNSRPGPSSGTDVDRDAPLSRPSMSDLFPSWTEAASDSAPIPPLREQTILVTGAGGSLGTALTEQLLAGPARRLVLVDTSEHGLVQLKQRVDALPCDDRPLVEYMLADLRLSTDRHRILETRPTIVLHAAAYKHVPFLEDRPIPATQNNLLATADWLAACRQCPSVDRFVLVSTDKAAVPTGVMGATKAAAERLVRAVRAEASPGLEASTVRLCNVFGSRGSVVPQFYRRLRRGLPLPVTHPAMERWFVSPEAAARSVLHSLRHEAGTYLPTACQSVSILRLAHRLLQWYHPDADPDGWIQIVGMRKGEQLQERLLAPTEWHGPPVDDVLLRVHREDPLPSLNTLHTRLDRLRELCSNGAGEAVRTALSKGSCPPDVPVSQNGNGTTAS